MGISVWHAPRIIHESSGRTGRFGAVPGSCRFRFFPGMDGANMDGSLNRLGASCITGRDFPGFYVKTVTPSTRFLDGTPDRKKARNPQPLIKKRTSVLPPRHGVHQGICRNLYSSRAWHAPSKPWHPFGIRGHPFSASSPDRVAHAPVWSGTIVHLPHAPAQWGGWNFRKDSQYLGIKTPCQGGCDKRSAPRLMRHRQNECAVCVPVLTRDPKTRPPG